MAEKPPEKRKRKSRVTPVEAAAPVEDATQVEAAAPVEDAAPTPIATGGRITSGIVGLDEVLEGGLRRDTATVVVGASGTGKSTFAMQYLLAGLDQGEQGLFITFDTKPKQILQECNLWGWERVQDYVDESLFFFASSGADFKQIITEELPRLVEARKSYDVPTRVVIDPITPILWAEQDKSVQRELVSALFSTLKEVGTVLATVEEHEGEAAVSSGESIPVFLSDGAVHLRYQPIGGAFNRTLEIIKMRGTRHGEEVYPYIFCRGVGAVVRTTPVFRAEQAREYGPVFEQAIQAARRENAPPVVLLQLEKMRDNWAYDFSPKEALEKFLQQHGIQRVEERTAGGPPAQQHRAA